MAERKQYLIAYDIADNRIRKKVATILKDYGYRIQKSVFECNLEDLLLRSLTYHLQRLDLDAEKDSIILYPVCLNCYRSKHSIGMKVFPEHNNFLIL